MQHQVSELNAVRRTFVLSAIALGGAFLTNAASARTTTIQVWKDPNCGCCKDWISHLGKNGFQVAALDQGNNAARSRLGMPQKFASCHTALIDGYVITTMIPAVQNHANQENHHEPLRIGLWLVVFGNSQFSDLHHVRLQFLQASYWT
jgi:hypothetical protein